jgi:CBS-domain-containing membrane protein
MQTYLKPLTSLTAEDVMSRNVLAIPCRMSLRAAACMLSKADITGAPVVDETGKCIGVLSAVDFLHAAQTERRFRTPLSDSCVCTAWQMVEMEQVPTEEVSTFMSKDPVTVSPSATIVELAKMMRDAHIHRIIVVDGKKRPIGIVSSTDIVAAVASNEE